MSEYMTHGRAAHLFSVDDVRWMGRALQIVHGEGALAAPSPQDACVIVRDGRIFGEAVQPRESEAPAEVKALAQAGSDAVGASAYLASRPGICTAYAPRCAQAMIDAGIARVVVAAQEPCARLDGGGFDLLPKAGIALELGLFGEDCAEPKLGFAHRARTGRPRVRLKLATSLDGRIAMASGESKWLTGTAARSDVQTLRAMSDAILTGIGTILADDPELTVRNHRVHRQPTRVILDSRGRLPATAKVLRAQGEVIVFRGEGPEIPLATNIVATMQTHAAIDLGFVLDELGARQVNDVLVEAGAILSGAFLRSGLVDELLLYQAPCLLGDTAMPMARMEIGRLVDKLNFRIVDTALLDGDLRIRLRPGA